ncbi:MAG: protease modulator HflC [Zetaproteobacteria bacterium CG_4_9_14_3_um_filter_49_83]|nr:MAG: HflC protein [Zetaproteobacteria bacterium CG1_02_49_23]PIQ33947.1 MAG: HflC protein [Zetaproteobacteria bacterium CG17_big_fil_post_rev_8_21_14_2_50_50_13]PIV30189.1 MAG: protease modulator HflC [Zetaproteobacteria bacterium CG02_land_8_20_14_3_00_50_9]PIY54877.1 MAG: protease modulator HflC [Zetaproteobacteria bacterium CG_4_10_14_0_8_um_filter_49_80]PJA35234.1 MAG: protease modulator HflC [Zetaproteobacteria bacterium CG_4_9_14_3_um_filter_49_83]
MNAKQTLISLIVAGVVILIGMSAFVVDQRQQALVLQFGNPIHVEKMAGLHFKLPWQSVVMFDLRLLESDAPPNEVITKDKKSINVDNYTRWKIIDPLKVFQVARTQNGVASRMEDVVRGKVREVLGQHTLHEIVSGGEEANLRIELMQAIRDRADASVKDLGIQVVDVRIKRADLPQENSNAVFQRMKAERQRIAKEYRSEGEEAAKEIRAEAEKTRKFILAEAYMDSQIIRGRADALTTAIYAAAHQKDAEFYGFLHSLESYRNSMVEGTQMVISPDSEFFDYFGQSKK